MTCPACDVAMQMVFDSRERTVWHCPRCGTMRSVMLGHVEDTVPALVKRCRDFENVLTLDDDAKHVASWVRLWIAESINVPDMRVVAGNLPGESLLP